jgi:cytochrome b involved in lipid metabolism
LMGSHPGGDDILLSRAGTDATKDFEVFEHSEKAVGWVRSPGRLRPRRNMHSCKLHLSSRVSFPLCRHCHWLSGPRAGS